MRNKKSYIPGFTMMDVLMGMAIMSIVIVMAYYVMTAAQQQMHLFGSTRYKLTQHVIHQQDLKRNFFETNSIKNLNNGFEIERSNESITYQLKENNLLRIVNQKTDTLWNEVHEIQKEFYTNHSNEITTDSVLKSVTVKTNFENLTLHTHLYKQYDNVSTINQLLIREF